MRSQGKGKGTGKGKGSEEESTGCLPDSRRPSIFVACMVQLALIAYGQSGPQYDRVARRIRNGAFTAVVASDASAARRRARSIGAEIWTDDFDALLADHSSAFDAVVLDSSGPLPARHCQNAAQAGKHVLADLPLAGSRDTALQVISACSEAGVCLMVGQALRFTPSLRTVKESLAAGQLGDPGLVRIHSWKATDDEKNRGHIDDSEPAAGAGLLLARVSREVDLACWLFDTRPDAVYAVESEAARPRSGGLPYLQLHLGFADGGMALIDSQTLPEGDGYFSLSLIGSTGAAYADGHHNMQLLYAGGRPAALEVREGSLDRLVELQEFIDSIRQRREPPVTAADALRVIEVAEAAVISLATGQAAPPGADS